MTTQTIPLDEFEVKVGNKPMLLGRDGMYMKVEVVINLVFETDTTITLLKIWDGSPEGWHRGDVELCPRENAWFYHLVDQHIEDTREDIINKHFELEAA